MVTLLAKCPSGPRSTFSGAIFVAMAAARPNTLPATFPRPGRGSDTKASFLPSTLISPRQGPRKSPLYHLAAARRRMLLATGHCENGARRSTPRVHAHDQAHDEGSADAGTEFYDRLGS
jgi:hypothetical protein